MSDLFPSAKDRLHPLNVEGMYSIPCSCGKSYVGQTGRSVTSRLKEHKRAILHRDTEKSAVAEHAYSEDGHQILIDETQVLAKEKFYHRRLIREAIEIEKCPQNFNRVDGVKLSQTWKRIFRKKQMRRSFQSGHDSPALRSEAEGSAVAARRSRTRLSSSDVSVSLLPPTTPVE